MNFQIVGGSWITSDGYGTLTEGTVPVPAHGKPLTPKAKDIFTEPLTRYGRFDKYTKLGCAAVALALKDAQLDSTVEKREIGLIISTAYECYENDLSFYNTTLEEGGSYSSPNKFSYTLPGIVIGECAVYFKLTGPTFCVGESFDKEFGYQALKTGLRLLESGELDTVVVGWLDAPPEELKDIKDVKELVSGAIFAVITRTTNKQNYYYKNGKITVGNRQLSSIIDFFKIN